MTNHKKFSVIFVVSLFTFVVGCVFIEPIRFGICRSEYTYHINERVIDKDDVGKYPSELVNFANNRYYTFSLATGCLDSTDESIGQPLIIFSLLVFIISTVLCFLKEQVFTSWLRFAKYYLPIATVLIFLSPTIDSSILGFDKEFMTWVLSGVFFIVSLGTIIFSARDRSASDGKH